MPNIKPDATEIRDFLIHLAAQDWVKRTERKWWPQFAFHYTDITNAINILRDGYIFSRHYAEHHNKLMTSSGSKTVLTSTHTEIKNCVRLYFRPKTPTQFWAEGVRSKDSLASSNFPDAHCPVPVFFLFDLADILIRSDSWFSDGGLASQKAKRNLKSIGDIKSLPWQNIYHIGSLDSFDPAQKKEIIFRRTAEILIPDKLDLDNLRYIYCRSQAEKETFLYLLSQDIKKRYQDKVVATSRSSLYFRQHTFLLTVRLTADTLDLNFSPDTQSPGVYKLTIHVNINGSLYAWEKEQTGLSDRFSIKFVRSVPKYEVNVFLDDHLIYANSFEEFEIPF